jgi:hypothetical protein
MGEVIVKPPNYAIPIRRRVGDKEVEGWYVASSGIVTAWHPNGRTKSTQVGSSPSDAVALMLLLELEVGHS